MPTFTGFKPEHFQFFKDLAKNNDTSWFRKHRQAYDSIVENLRGIVDDLAPFVLSFDPNFEVSGKIGANLSRINRDIRFSKDKSPYKQNLYVFFYRRGTRPKATGRLYVGLTTDCVTAGFSIYSSDEPTGALKHVFLPRIQTHLESLVNYLHAKNIARRYDAMRYIMEKRDWREAEPLPKTVEDWLQTQGWVVRKRFTETHRGLDRPSFLTTLQSVFLDLMPLVVFTSYPEKDWRNRFESLSRTSAESPGRKASLTA